LSLQKQQAGCNHKAKEKPTDKKCLGTNYDTTNLSNIASRQRFADKDVRNIGKRPYGGGYHPLNTEKGSTYHSLHGHTGVTGVDVFTRSAATIILLPTEFMRAIGQNGSKNKVALMNSKIADLSGATDQLYVA